MKTAVSRGALVRDVSGVGFVRFGFTGITAAAKTPEAAAG